MKLLQAVIAAATFGLGALIIIAMTDGSFSRAGSWLLSEPWGLVTLVDLYLGFLLSAAVIWFFRTPDTQCSPLDPADPHPGQSLDRRLVHHPTAALARNAMARR